ncbi:hypothetical protein JSY36_14575 [Bacillus sp. H-16]|uniref:methyltransferase family protein n=1 Tax=Alteribacter salitolerans TaxID=2912333 RepID=UPI0019625A06|nr:methyltransferase [Alteribacter salitolerans]MBM7096958.1 hypothetical protein [Alteribacter salitolerans]
MTISTMIFIALLTLWVAEWFIFKESPRLRKEVLRGSIRVKGLVAFTFVLSLAMAFHLGQLNIEPMWMAKSCGLFFLILGIALRYWTYAVTRTYFSRGLSYDENRPLFSHGPFRLHRHPYQTGFFFMTLGVCLYISGHWFVLLTTFTVLGSALHYRMSLEEEVLKRVYGEIYGYWCRHRFRIFPYLY